MTLFIGSALHGVHQGQASFLEYEELNHLTCTGAKVVAPQLGFGERRNSTWYAQSLPLETHVLGLAKYQTDPDGPSYQLSPHAPNKPTSTRLGLPSGWVLGEIHHRVPTPKASSSRTSPHPHIRRRGACSGPRSAVEIDGWVWGDNWAEAWCDLDKVSRVF